MPVSVYHKGILKMRNKPAQATEGVRERIDESSKIALARIDTILRSAEMADGRLSVRVWRSRQNEIIALLNDFAVDVKRDLNRSIDTMVDEIAEERERLTRNLMRENNVSLAFDFAGVPRHAVELLAQRQDVEGFKFRTVDWAEAQQRKVNQIVLAARISGQSVDSTADLITPFIIGQENLTAAQKAALKERALIVDRPIGLSVNAKAKRIARTEAANASWEAHRLAADESPIVAGLKWNLSATHADWDSCDILAAQNAYGLGEGVYPPNKIPPRPHPNDRCFQTDAIRPVLDWDKPKPEAKRQKGLTVSGAMGTERHIEVQTEIAESLMRATDAT